MIITSPAHIENRIPLPRSSCRSADIKEPIPPIINRAKLLQAMRIRKSN